MSEAITCFKCGILFSVPTHWLKCRRQDKDTFWCPNGHGQAFVESEADKLRRERDRLKQSIAMWEDDARQKQELIEQANRQARAFKGQVTKLKKRASTGTCPCCNRHFDNLQRHMETKHPEMVEHKVVPIKRPA